MAEPAGLPEGAKVRMPPLRSIWRRPDGRRVRITDIVYSDQVTHGWSARLDVLPPYRPRQHRRTTAQASEFQTGGHYVQEDGDGGVPSCQETCPGNSGACAEDQPAIPGLTPAAAAASRLVDELLAIDDLLAGAPRGDTAPAMEESDAHAPVRTGSEKLAVRLWRELWADETAVRTQSGRVWEEVDRALLLARAHLKGLMHPADRQKVAELDAKP